MCTPYVHAYESAAMVGAGIAEFTRRRGTCGDLTGPRIAIRSNIFRSLSHFGFAMPAVVSGEVSVDWSIRRRRKAILY